MQLPIENPHWYRHPERACLGAKPEEFYELSEGKTARARLYAAVVIEENCNRCPVLNDCLAETLNNEGDIGGKHRYGILGGLTPEQRAVRARALRKPINHGTTGGYKAHRRLKEKPCDQCLAAKSAYEKKLRGRGDAA